MLIGADGEHSLWRGLEAPTLQLEAGRGARGQPQPRAQGVQLLRDVGRDHASISNPDKD